MANQSIRSVCPYCGVGCGIVMQVENNKVVKVIGDKAHPTNFGRLCSSSVPDVTRSSSQPPPTGYWRHFPPSRRC